MIQLRNLDTDVTDLLTIGRFGAGRPLLGPKGQVFWVDSSATNKGSGTPTAPFGTIVQAHSKCIAGRGDVILVNSGHTETITAAGGLTLSKSNVSVVGIGNGSQRPNVAFTTSANASVLMSGAGVRLAGLKFTLTGITALANPVSVTAADCVIEDCISIGGITGPFVPLRWILTNASANRLMVRNNSFISQDNTSGTVSVIRVVGGLGIRIEDNYFDGYFTLGVGGIQTLTTDSTNMRISRNVIINRTTSSTTAIAATSGTTGVISDNRMQILSGTTPIVAAAMFWGGNYYGPANTAGTLI